MVAQPEARITAEEFAALQRDGLRTELIAGEIVTMPPAFLDHGDIALELGSLVKVYVKKHKLGKVFGAETGFLIARDPDTVRAPDFAFIQASRYKPARRPFWGTIVPDLVGEVVSSGDRPIEVMAKVQIWLDAGVRLVWVVNPVQHTIVVHRAAQPTQTLDETATLEGSDVLPGFTVPVAEIFAEE